jgi:hypothetical protein
MAKKTGDNANSQKLLLENFISLQKILTNLTVKIDETDKKLSKMLELFEAASKSYGQGRMAPSAGVPQAVQDARLKEIAGKIDILMEQNRDIAKGIILLEQVTSERTETPEELKPKPLPESQF